MPTLKQLGWILFLLQGRQKRPRGRQTTTRDSDQVYLCPAGGPRHRLREACFWCVQRGWQQRKVLPGCQLYGPLDDVGNRNAEQKYDPLHPARFSQHAQPGRPGAAAAGDSTARPGHAQPRESACQQRARNVPGDEASSLLRRRPSILQNTTNLTSKPSLWRS